MSCISYKGEHQSTVVTKDGKKELNCNSVVVDVLNYVRRYEGRWWPLLTCDAVRKDSCLIRKSKFVIKTQVLK